MYVYMYVHINEHPHILYLICTHFPPHTFSRALYYTYRACVKQRLEVVQCLLMRSGSGPLSNISGNDSPIHIACEKRNHKIAHALLNHSPRLMYAIQIDNLTPLHIACNNGDLEMVRFICDHIRSYVTATDAKEGEVLPPDTRDISGRTPFFIACFHGYLQIVQELCQLKEYLGNDLAFDVNSLQIDTNRTPLHAAVSKGSFETVHLLLTLEETDKNIEALPSSSTQELFLRNIEMKRHGRLLLPTDTDMMSMSCEEPLTISVTETSLNHTAAIFHYSTSANHIGGGGGGDRYQPDTGVGSSMHDDTNTSTLPNAYTSTASQVNFTLPVPRKLPDSKAPATKRLNKVREETEDVPESENRALAIFLTQREDLVVGKKERAGGTVFSKLVMSPLAEACALGYNEIAEELLRYGGYDKSGVACRIAHLAQSYDLMQHILSRCCSVVKKERIGHGSSSASSDKQHSQTEPGLRVSWSGKKLPELKGEWFTDSAVYYVDKSHSESTENDEEMVLEASRNLRRVNPLNLRQLTLAEMPIKEINLRGNNLKWLPIEIFELEHLTELIVNNNRIIELPEPEDGEMWKCIRLEQINLSYNNLLRLPACLWKLPNLRKICISHNNISTFSESDIPLGELSTALSSLDLSHNSIGPELPAFIFEFPALEKVFLSKNNISELPNTMWLCPTLQELKLNNNQIVTLPWCEPNLEASSSDTYVSSLFQQHQVLTGVVQVKPNAAGNPYLKQKSSIYRSIKPSGGELSWVNYCVVNTESYDYSMLKKLDLSRNKVTHFPESLPCLAPNLIEFNISHNPIHFVDIQHVPQSMKKLICRNCEIGLIGNVMSSEESKKTVQVCRCLVDTYEGKSCQHRNHPRLNHLTSLELTQNRLRHFQLIEHRSHGKQNGKDPGELLVEKVFQPSLSSLQLLYPALENLDLSKNDLQGLFNPNIGHQSHLKSIKLNGNPELEQIPYTFSNLKKSKDFTELTMSDLPKLFEPPVEYQKADLSHVMTYMRSCLKE